MVRGLPKTLKRVGGKKLISRIMKKLNHFFIVIVVALFVGLGVNSLAGCMDGYEEKDAHTYIDGSGRVITHCPYAGGNTICCVPEGGGAQQ